MTEEELAACMRLWSITCDKDIPLSQVVCGFRNIPRLNQDFWLAEARKRIAESAALNPIGLHEAK